MILRHLLKNKIPIAECPDDCKFRFDKIDNYAKLTGSYKSIYLFGVDVKGLA